VGTTNIITILMDLAARIHCRSVVPTASDKRPETVLGQIISSIEEVKRQAAEKPADDEGFAAGRRLESTGRPAAGSGMGLTKKLLGIGIGMAGLLNGQRTGVDFSPDFGWENVELTGELKDYFHLPVYMDNVTRAMAMGEHWFGLGRDRENFMCINLGYGIGAALFINGELYRGSSGSSGEFGHMNMEKNGPLCACGNYGCLEALASANAMVNSAKFQICKGTSTLIMDLAGQDANRMDAKLIFDAARQGDRLALEIVYEATHYLGTAIASMINVFDPGLIILEGGVSRAGSILTENIQRVVEQKRMRYAGNSTQVVASQSHSIAAIGAAAFLLKELVENGGDVSRFQ